MTNSCLGWAVASRVHTGESLSGDSFRTWSRPFGDLVAVVDALGHGNDAAAVAKDTLAALDPVDAATVFSLIGRCHERLRGTRGAALSLVSFDTRNDTMTWLGVGNVGGVLWRVGEEPRRTEALLLRNGVVGFQLPPLHGAVVPLRRGDTLVLATDGVREGFPVDVRRSPQQIADTILSSHAKGTDDALVFVAQYLGGGA